MVTVSRVFQMLFTIVLCLSYKKLICNTKFMKNIGIFCYWRDRLENFECLLFCHDYF